MSKKIVYHYCNINTFYSIISNQTLRLSDITKSNDRLEMTWAISIIRKVFEEKYESLDTEIKSAIKIENYMDCIEQKISLYFEQNELRNKFFVICFSGQNSGDLLSQWRGYGDDGRGIALGFREQTLNRISDSVRLYEGNDACILYNKVLYDEKNQKNKIEEIVGHFLSKLNAKCKSENLGLDNELESILLECFPRLYQEAIFMKNPFFQEENESRLVICEGNAGKQFKNGEIDNLKKQYYIRKNQLVGYYDISLQKVSQKTILKLIIGPKCDNDKASLLSFLKDNNFQLKESDIVYSKGSYR